MVARKATRNRMVRRSRALMVSSRHWKARFVFWLGALALGLVSAAFATSSDYSQAIFETITGHGHGPLRFLPLIITPLGFILCAWIADKFFPGSQGSGIPQVIATRRFDSESDRTIYLSPRIVIGKVVMTVIALGCGASIGREGPTVQI
ncbi:chloride channel protein, partial [Thioclava sp. BHET1]